MSTTRIAEFFGANSSLPYITVERDARTDDIDIVLRDTSGAFEYALALTPAAAIELGGLLDLAIARAHQAAHDANRGARLAVVS